MKKFGLDIDGTITCPTAFIPYLNEHFNKNITLDDIKEYDFTSVVNVPQKQFGKWIAGIEGEVYSKSPIQSGVQEILKTWAGFHELVYISARHERHLDITKDWLERHKLPFNHVELIGSHQKINAVKEHGVQLFFEDKHDNAVDISQECDIPVILFDAPYNRKPIPKNVIRVSDWTEASKWVNYWTKE